MGAYLSEELEALVREGYARLTVPSPSEVGVCTDCCMSPETARAMLATPVRDMPERMVREWYAAAYGTDAGLGHLYWLLPRVLDLLAQGREVATVGNEVVFRGCGETAPIRDWPEARRDLVTRFAAALVEARLSLERPDLDAQFCMFSQGGMDLRPILDRLDATPAEWLAQGIVADWRWGAPGIGRNAFWTDEADITLVRGWFAREALADRLLVWATETGSDTGFEAADIVMRGLGAT